jgi:hypothetical protein
MTPQTPTCAKAWPIRKQTCYADRREAALAGKGASDVRRTLAWAAGAAGGLLALPLAAAAGEMPQAAFAHLMNTAFGPGKWRETGGYRTREREDQLRAQGALTVRPGAVSRHSVGRPGAPGAYDVVVPGMSPGEAAAVLRRSGLHVGRLLPESAHGSQGPHLHIEPVPGAGSAAAASRPTIAWTVVEPTPAEAAANRLHEAAAEGDAASQLQLAEIDAQGRGVPRDLRGAYFWAAQASANSGADTATRSAAGRLLETLSRTMSREDVADARRVAAGVRLASVQPTS